MCDFYNAMDVHVSTVSTLHILCISIDRSEKYRNKYRLNIFHSFYELLMNSLIFKETLIISYFP